MVIWDDLRIDLWQPHIGHAGSAKDNPVHAVVVFTRVLSPNWNRLLCLRLQETTEESFTHWISYLYTLNTIKHHRMMKTTHTVTVLSKPFCTTMNAFSWTLPHYLLPWQGAGDAADTSIGAGPGPSPVRTDGAGCGLALATKEWWLYGVNMCKCYFQWFVYFFSYLEQNRLSKPFKEDVAQRALSVLAPKVNLGAKLNVWLQGIFLPYTWKYGVWSKIRWCFLQVSTIPKLLREPVGVLGRFALIGITSSGDLTAYLWKSYLESA